MAILSRSRLSFGCTCILAVCLGWPDVLLAQMPPACTPASTNPCTISFTEPAYGVPQHLRTHLGLPPTGDPVDLTRVAIVVPDNGALPTPPVVFFAGGHGSTALTNLNNGPQLQLAWPEAVIVYLEANMLVDHDGQFRAVGDPALGDTDWAPRAPYMAATVDHSDIPYLQNVLLATFFTFQFDASRMYLAGHSSGGFFTLAMRALMPEAFRAFAALGTEGDYLHAGNDVPAVVAAGQHDPAKPVMYVMGVREQTFPWHPAAIGSSTRVYDTVRQLTAINGARVPGQDDQQYLADLVNGVLAAAPANRMLQEVFDPVKTNGAQVVLVVYGGNHSWPPRNADDGSLVASNWVVQFFQQHMGPVPSQPTVLFERGWPVPALVSPLLR